jgi:glutamine---fructose-6-phosphate transaminase (isomerizing)
MTQAYSSLMAEELQEVPGAIERCLRENERTIADIANLVRKVAPSHIITCARGSSDHAAGYFKYLSEIVLGVPCCSVGASVASVYQRKLGFRDTLILTISQSGASPDIVAMQVMAREAGIPTIAITNDPASPLAKASDICVPLFTGPEKSVAATKTFVTSAALAAAVVARTGGHIGLESGLRSLPEALGAAQRQDWLEIEQIFVTARSGFVIGRGPSLPIALEAALKLKETCAIHAEGYSAAEVMHGPVEIISREFPVLAFIPPDAAETGTVASMKKLSEFGAMVRTAPFAKTMSPLLDPLSIIQSFYVFVEHLARKIGRDPDRPRLLRKVTMTV